MKKFLAQPRTLLFTILFLWLPSQVFTQTPKAYISNYGSNNLSVINTATNTVTATVATGMWPYSCAVTPNGTKAYVTNFGSNTISVINTATNTVSATIPMTSFPAGLVITPDGSKVYVTNSNGTTISVISTATDVVIASVPLTAQYVYDLAITPNGATIYAARSNFIYVISTASNTVTSTINAANGSDNFVTTAITPDGTKAYTVCAGGNRVAIINTATKTITGYINVGTNPFGISITPNGTAVYVANRGSNNISVIDIAANAVTATIPVGTFPVGIDITPDGTKAYVTNRNSNNVSVINTSTNTVDATVGVGTNPGSFAKFIGTPPALPATHLNFDGVDDVVNIGSIIPNASSYTKEAWIFCTADLGANNILSSASNPFWVPGLHLSAGNNNSFTVVQDPIAIPTNTWIHAAVTYDAATTTMKLYKNGVLVATNTAAPAFVAEPGFLASHEGFNSFFQGNMDEVRIWNIALSADDINRRKNCELQGNETGLIAYYKFNQGFAESTNTMVTTLTNTVSGGTNGMLSGFALTGAASNWLSGSPVITGSNIPAAPTVITPLIYTVGTVTAALTATGTNLLWFTNAAGGTGSATAPTPSSVIAGTTSYWVASSNANGCQSQRVQINVTVVPKSTATHLNFDGVNDAIALSATGFPTGNTSRTIEAWIRTTQNNGGGAIMTYGSLSTNNRFALYQTGGKLNFVAEGNDYNTNVVINDGVWHHVAATHDGTSLKVYVDGVQAGTTQAKTFNTTGTQFSIGYRGVTAEFFKGDIDEVRIWNTARSAAQISAGRNCPLVGNEAGLLAYYRFDHGFPGGTNTTVTTLTDATANNNNGTLSGFALSGNTSNWQMTSPLVTGPDVTNNVNYCLNSSAAALSAPGSGLLWYTTRFGGTGSSTAPTPATNAAGTTSYWVTQPTTCGESPRSKIDVVVNANPLTAAAANKIQTLAVSGNTVFANNCLDLITSVNPNGAAPVSGNTTAKVWIEATQPSTPGAQFVKRHYEITPATNAATATARVTLYFTQPEFDAFNAISTVDLPTGPADAAGKANLLVEKRSGVSGNGTGLPSSYTGSVSNLNPADADIVWNSAQNRWEISFDVTGFSGFFVKTLNGFLPLRLLSFTGNKQSSNDVLLQWQATNEINSSRFEIEVSSNGNSFVKLGTVAAKNTSGVNSYNFTDNSIWISDTRYYRLKIIDNDGKFNYSTVIKMNTKQIDGVTIYPNPVPAAFVLNVNNSHLINTAAKIVDMSGSTLMVFTVNSRYQNIDISRLAGGIYFLRFTDGTSVKLIKQ